MLLDSIFTRSQLHVHWTLCGGILLVLLSGCGDGRMERVPVAGQVLIDGKPLTYGEIMFIPAQGRASRGTIDQNGRFTLTCFENEDGAVLGTHKVAIRAAESIDFATTRWHAPKKLSDHHTSELTQEITAPTDNLVINISWDGGKPFTEVDETATDGSGRYSKKKSK